MINSTYVFRSYQLSDFGRYARLKNEAEKLKPGGRYISPQMIAENLSMPGYSPEQNIFVVEAGSNIVGYAELVPELAIGRVILDCWVKPEHRRMGLATGLLDCAIKHIRELGARVAHVNIAEDNKLAASVLSKLGFSPVRRHLELRLDMNEAQMPGADEAVLACRPLQYGEEDKLTRIQNSAFEGSWGFNPNTVEEIKHNLNRKYSSPADVMLTCEGDRIVGCCWTGATCEEGDDEKTGRIFMIGVSPDYRSRGIGRRVLLAGLAHLRGKGLQYVELTVDSENEAACSLYQSIGFKTRESSLWYEKAI